MIQKFEMIDKDGRYMTCRYDGEHSLLMVTTYLYPNKDVPIEKTLENCGYTITSKSNIKKPKIITLTKGTKNEKSIERTW